MKRTFLVVVFLLLVSCVVSAQGKKDSTLTKDTVKIEQLDLSKYEFFDSKKDIDLNIKELIELRQKRLNELVQSDVVYNRYDAVINTLNLIKNSYDDKKILRLKPDTVKKK